MVTKSKNKKVWKENKSMKKQRKKKNFTPNKMEINKCMKSKKEKYKILHKSSIESKN